MVSEKGEYMTKKTRLRERIFYGLIGIVMLVSTFGAYIAMAMSTQDQADKNAEMAAFQQKYNKWKEHMDGVAEELSIQYYPELKEYESYPKEYNAESIKELGKVDLKIGDGEEVTADTKYRAYYIGWLSNGEVFDGSFEGDSLKNPIESGSFIEGWNQGVLGMRIGGIRELSIPSEMAYGDQGQGTIPANSPLKFIIKLIPPMTAEELAEVPSIN